MTTVRYGLTALVDAALGRGKGRMPYLGPSTLRVFGVLGRGIPPLGFTVHEKSVTAGFDLCGNAQHQQGGNMIRHILGNIVAVVTGTAMFYVIVRPRRKNGMTAYLSFSEWVSLRSDPV